MDYLFSVSTERNIEILGELLTDYVGMSNRHLSDVQDTDLLVDPVRYAQTYKRLLFERLVREINQLTPGHVDPQINHLLTFCYKNVSLLGYIANKLADVNQLTVQQ